MQVELNSRLLVTVATRIIARLAALALLGTVSLGVAQAAQTTIQANAKVVKSLTLTKIQDLDFGTITLSGTPGTYTVSLSMAGALTCPSGATCAGTAVPAILNVSGSKSQSIRITVASGNLVNAVDGSTLSFTPVAPASITLTNSGAPGNNFNVGGSIAIPSTADGVYSGNIQVTAEYQ
jgi:hypothetical protein